MRLAVYLALTLCVSVSIPECWALQFGVNNPYTNASRFIAPPRTLNQKLRAAETAIEDEQYSEAIVILGDLLEQDASEDKDFSLGGQDFFLEIQEVDQQRLDQSFLRKCRSMIGELPPKAQATYELRYGALAKQLLGKATAARDWKLLGEVRRKYFHTEAGYSASVLMAQREMSLGHPLAASMLLDDVVANRAALEQLGDGVRLLHSAASRLAGRRVTTDPSVVSTPYQLGGETVESPIESWREWVGENYQVAKQESLSRALDYRMLGGTPARNETAQGQLPLSTARWMVETTATPREEQLLRRKSDELAASGQLVPPSWLPIRVGDQLLMRTTERLMGVDHRTGKRVWQYPWFQTKDSLESEQAIAIPGRGPADPADALGRRVWNDIPYGQIVSDGDRVFLLDDLSTSQVAQFNRLIGMRNVQSVDGARNTLVALELATEGKMLWRLGQNSTIESELNEGFFLGPPLTVEDDLYVMVELAGDILLACLDPATGKTQWKQQLVAVEGLGIQFDALRRVSGATPSFHQGVLVCPTGGSATVAVNLSDRTLRWGNSYPRRAGSNPMSNFSRRPQSSDDLLRRWHHPAPLMSGDSVVITSPVTDTLYCYDLVDGKQRFKKPRQASFFVAGIRDDQLLTVSNRSVTSYDLETGRLNWETESNAIVSGQQIIGRGVFGSDSYIIPTTGNELIRFSLGDGSVLERRVTRFPLGNLIAVDGEIISQGATQLAVALGSETLGPRVEKMLEENPNDLDALIQKALLLTEQNKRSESLVWLQRARAIDPDSDDVLILSINAMLGVLRDSDEPPAGMMEELDTLIDTPSQRLEFLALKVDTAVRSKSIAEAASGLFEFSTVLADAALLGNEDESILRDPSRDCSLDAWVAARSQKLADLAEEQGKTAMLQERLAEFVKVKRLGSTRLLTALVRHYESLGVDELVSLLADRKLAEDDRFSAERLLIGPADLERFFEVGETSVSVPRKLQLARNYAEGRLSEDAMALLKSLETDGDATETPPPKDQPTTEPDPEDQARDTSPEQLEILKAVAKIRQSAEAGVSVLKQTLFVDEPVSLQWESHEMPRGASRNFNLEGVSHPDFKGGRSFHGWQLTNGISGTNFRGPLGENLRLPVQTGIVNRRAKLFASIGGGVMLMEQPGEITAINLFMLRAGRPADAKLWSRSFGAGGKTGVSRKSQRSIFGDSIDLYSGRSVTAGVTREFRVGPLLGDRVFVLQSGDLMALGLDDGETLWRNSNAPGTGVMVTNGKKVAVVSYQQPGPATVTEFNVLDGEQGETRPWEYGQVWADRGEHVLAYSAAADRLSAVVRLINPLNNEVILERETFVNDSRTNAPNKALGRIVQKRFMILYDTDGMLTVWDLLKATELCRHKLEAIPDLETLHAMWMGDQLLVLPAKNMPGKNTNKLMTLHGDTRTVHQLIALSTKTGEINWQRDFEVPWGCTTTQPGGSPVLVLVRSRPTYSVQESPPMMDVMLLRLSDGVTIHEEVKRELSSNATVLTTQVRVQPLQQMVLVQIDGHSLRYRFGAEVTEQSRIQEPR